MKVYISGRISGRELEVSKRHFKEAEEKLSEMGLDAVNPFSNGLSDSETWEAHMLKDIEMLFPCDAIYMLSGWSESKGAKIEKSIAEIMGKRIMYEKNKVVSTKQQYHDAGNDNATLYEVDNFTK